MPKSTGRSWFGRGSPGSGGRRGGTVTVIEDRVSRSYARTARIAFYVITAVVGALAATIATAFPQIPHPIVGLLVGLLVGVAVALPISGLIAAWPVIRVIWWWTSEILAALVAVYGFTALSLYTPLGVRLALVLTVIVTGFVPQVRHTVMRVVWCLISRHRLRTCFNQFIIANRSGTLPLILWATPTPVGERVWIWLRPGLSLDDLQGRLDKIAVACWAATITAEKASTRNAAYVRVDIKRRDALEGTVTSPLVDQVDPATPVASRATTTAPTALDLPDIPADTQQPAPAARDKRTTKRADKRADTKPAADPAPAPATTGAAEDLLDWV